MSVPPPDPDHPPDSPELPAASATPVVEQAATAVQAVAQTAQAAAQAVAPTVAAVAPTVQAAAATATTATHQAQAAVQQVAQQATVSPRRAVVSGRNFLVGYALALAALAYLAQLARRYKVLPGDVGLTRLLQREDSPVYDAMMSLVSEMGWQWPSVITRLTTAGLTWSAGFRMEGAFIAATWSGDVVTQVVKELVNRPRPTRDLVRVRYTLGEHSFPSGHVVHYVTFYGFLFYIFWTHLKHGAWRTAALTVLALIIVLIGPSRVYQGAHWPSDVGGAYLVGSLWLAVQIVAYLECKAHFQILTGWPFVARRSREL